VSESDCFCITAPHDRLKKLAPLFIQSEVKPKPIVTPPHTFSRASRQLRIITSSFDWFTGFSASFVIGQSDNSGFGFLTLK